MIETNIKGKVILVAGATGGIGSGVARKLNREGARLILLGRNEVLLKELQEELQGETDFFVCDFMEIEKLNEVFLFVKEQGCKLDGMVYAAGFCEDLPLKSVSFQDMQKCMTLNYYAYVELCKHFSSKRYSNEGSSIVALSSMATSYCDKAMSQYAASKSAVNAATKSMAREFARRKIRVNAVAPGLVDTRMATGMPDLVEGGYEAFRGERQTYGIIPVDEIANLIEFLLSEVSGHITGEVLRVIGGVY